MNNIVSQTHCLHMDSKQETNLILQHLYSTSLNLNDTCLRFACAQVIGVMEIHSAWLMQIINT